MEKKICCLANRRHFQLPVNKNFKKWQDRKNFFEMFDIGGGILYELKEGMLKVEKK